MLFLQPPFHIVEGVAVFGDHANKQQFYYMPAMPKLTTTLENGKEIPQLQLLKFRGGTGNGGGFLTFGVNLGIEQDRLDMIAMGIKQIYQLTDPPILAPVVLEDGTVRLIMLGQETPAPATGGGGHAPASQPAAGSDGQPPRFVVKINQAAKPALYGKNQAIFSVELDEEGVQLVEASLQGELMPIGVIYSLDFLALRPAFTVHVTADWNRVQTHFEESSSTKIFFSSKEIDTVVDKLIEDRVIVIDVDSFLPEGEDGGSWVGRRDQAVNDFKDMVIDFGFTPSIEPMKDEKDGWNKFTDTAERLSLLSATGGWAGVAQFSYKKVDWTRRDEKTMNLTMNERVTVRRRIYPQATIKGLSKFLRDAQGQIDLSRFVTPVDLNSDWFQKRKITTHALVDFDYESVESVLATLTYGDRPQTVRLTGAESSAARDWNSIINNNAMKREVDYEYRVTFKGVDTAQRPGVLNAQKSTSVGDELELTPRADLYYVDEIHFGTDLPWDRFSSVMIETRYDDPENAIHLAETFLLNKSQSEAKWKRFRLNPRQAQYQVKISYFGASTRDLIGDWTTSDQERMLIRDPRPGKRTVTVVPAVNWGLVSMVLVEIKYIDEANDVDEEQTLSFLNTPQDKGPKTFAVNLVDPAQRLVYYTPTILLNDNRVITVPPSATVGTSIFIRSDMLGHRIVTVQPADINFATRGIVRIEADLGYADPGAGLYFQDHYTFQSAQEVQFFEFDYATNGNYNCLMRIVFANGLVQERDLGNLNSDKLILAAS